jgi:hypothetical protein
LAVVCKAVLLLLLMLLLLLLLLVLLVLGLTFADRKVEMRDLRTSGGSCFSAETNLEEEREESEAS